MRLINVAIDGYSACGKSTLAKQIAKILKYKYIDTGAMYRAITLYALQNECVVDNKLEIDILLQALPNLKIDFKYNMATYESAIYLNDVSVESAIRTIDVARWVSAVSAIKEVRKKLVTLQQEIANQKGVVMDGRDIGSVVIPDAEVKLFMTANPTIRTERRYKELIGKGQHVNKEEIHQNLIDRDYQDTHRAEDPLIQCDDAYVLDNSHMDTNQQLNQVLFWVDAAIKSY